MSDQNNAEPIKTTLNSVPPEWPGAFGIYKYSKQVIMLNLGTFLLLALISIAVGIVTGLLKGFVDDVIGFVVSVLISAGIILTLLAGIRKQHLSVKQAIKNGLPYLVKMVLLYLLSAIILVVSLLLLIVPFFIVLPRLVLAEYFLIDQKMGVVDSLKASWVATKDHVGKVWDIIGVNVLMMLLVFTIIGIPVAIYLLIMYSAAWAVLYEFITKQKPAVSQSSPS